MPAHKYICGQQVRFRDRRVLAPGPVSEFMVVKLLPMGDEAPRDEVQGSYETFTRVAEEIIPEGVGCDSWVFPPAG